jgi:hypothetical protein
MSSGGIANLLKEAEDLQLDLALTDSLLDFKNFDEILLKLRALVD